MKEDFLIKIETWHKPDLGSQENVSSTSQEPQGLQASEQGPEALPCSFTIPTLGVSVCPPFSWPGRQQPLLRPVLLAWDCSVTNL